METDYLLIKNKDYYKLWEKYSPLLHKFYYKAPKGKYESFEDFSHDCYETVAAAADKVNLSRIKSPLKWTFYIQLYHYLQNKIRSDYVHFHSESSLPEIPLGHYDSSYDLTEAKALINKAIQRLPERDRKILANNPTFYQRKRIRRKLKEILCQS